MKAVILAAGIAKRLQPLTNNISKCLLKIGEKEILSYILQNLQINEIRNVIIVTGFCADKIKNFLDVYTKNFDFTVVHNHDYTSTNNAYSLLLAEKHVQDDFLLLDSDILFSHHIIPLLKNFEKNYIRLAVKRHDLSEEEIKVKINSEDRILRIGKEVKINEAYAESIGIEYFPKEYVPFLFHTLQKRINQEQRLNEFYEASFQEMIDQDVPFYSVDIGNLDAIEIDFPHDLKYAEGLILDKKVFD